ncbi:hypothetical protein [Aeromonas dhakensis]|uniref:hypothetical protein n=2 Tax=Aeromonas dhakensis TaxID=196024 RepID=UPI0018A6ED78|nr:hypothetical protein [Aeromonas dhakensis]MBF8451936.1 hypothetical protein [Aeromonas dhakensis]
MQKKLIGEYSVIEVLISATVFSFLCYVNWLFFKGFSTENEITQHHKFMVVFINLVCLVLVALPYLTKKSKNIPNKSIENFLDLPDKDSKFTFPIISNFMGEQALSSFLATVLIFTGKGVLENYGGAIAAIYALILFIVAILLGTVSLIRFITHFTKYHGAIYVLASILSVGVMFAFFNIGLRLAP